MVAEAEPFDANWIGDPSKLCRENGVDSKGGIGPFGLFVLASQDLEENTAIYFRIFRANGNYKVLMCTDSTRYHFCFVRNIIDKVASGVAVLLN